MENPDPAIERAATDPLPRWVRCTFPLGLGPRSDRIRSFWYYVIAFIVFAVFVGLPAFIFNGDLHPFRWWILGFFVFVFLGFCWERRVIRWLDRHKKWPA